MGQSEYLQVCSYRRQRWYCPLMIWVAAPLATGTLSTWLSLDTDICHPDQLVAGLVGVGVSLNQTNWRWREVYPRQRGIISRLYHNNYIITKDNVNRVITINCSHLNSQLLYKRWNKCGTIKIKDEYHQVQTSGLDGHLAQPSSLKF